MQSFQDRVLAKIEAMANKHETEVSQSANYANTGTINVHDIGHTSAMIVIGYDFQAESYKLTLTINGEKVPANEFYQRNESPCGFWKVFEAALRNL